MKRTISRTQPAVATGDKVSEMHFLISNFKIRRRLLSLKCRRKVLLTGTPIANSLVEMVSLLMFLMPRTFKSVGDDVMSLFENSSKNRLCVLHYRF